MSSLRCVILLLLLPVWLLENQCLALDKNSIDIPSSGLSLLIVQDGGRKKPLDTYARENLIKLTGRSKWKDSEGGEWTALEVIADMFLGTNNWQKEKLIKVGHILLKKEVGLDINEKFFSYQDLHTNQELMKNLSQIIRIEEDAPQYDKTLSFEAKVLLQKIRLVEKLTASEAFSWIPAPKGESWFSLIEGIEFYKEKGKNIQQNYENLKTVYLAGGDRNFSDCVNILFENLRSLVSPNDYPQGKIRIEVFYNNLHPFRLAWIACLISFVLMLIANQQKSLGKAIYWFGLGVFGLGTILQVIGFILRTVISSRAPVTNMYEVLVFMALGASLIAFFYELFCRSKIFILSAAVVTAVVLILADNLPTVFDPSIQPLVPVLRSNWWLTVHVITITIGYAAFLQALGIGHISVFYYLFKPQEEKSIQSLTKFNCRTMQIGVFFLSAGTLLGALWAEKAWGRFWGWDPKETWALIALLIYLAVLHARYVGWIKGFGLNAASILAFQGIIMAGYGVNYILGTGKHSYGFGIGGEEIVAIFVGIEILLVLFAVKRYRMKRLKND